jgi:hypothetical protein
MSFIRQARTMGDKHGNVCYYIDGDFIRQASTMGDKHGNVCYYMDEF